jgi:hypothetical protein
MIYIFASGGPRPPAGVLHHLRGHFRMFCIASGLWLRRTTMIFDLNINCRSIPSRREACRRSVSFWHRSIYFTTLRTRRDGFRVYIFAATPVSCSVYCSRFAACGKNLAVLTKISPFFAHNFFSLRPIGAILVSICRYRRAACNGASRFLPPRTVSELWPENGRNPANPDFGRVQRIRR